MTAKVICIECRRVFDLTDIDEGGEFYYGHDCEEQEPPVVSPGLRDREPWSGGFADNH